MHCVYCGRPLQAPHPGYIYPGYERPLPRYFDHGTDFYKGNHVEGKERQELEEGSAYWFKQEANQFAKQFDDWAN